MSINTHLQSGIQKHREERVNNWIKYMIWHQGICINQNDIGCSVHLRSDTPNATILSLLHYWWTDVQFIYYDWEKMFRCIYLTNITAGCHHFTNSLCPYWQHTKHISRIMQTLVSVFGVKVSFMWISFKSFKIKMFRNEMGQVKMVKPVVHIMSQVQIPTFSVQIMHKACLNCMAMSWIILMEMLK